MISLKTLPNMLILAPLLSLSACEDLPKGNTPEIPISHIQKDTLAPFVPLVLEDLHSNSTTQDSGRTHRTTKEYGYQFFKMFEGDFSYSEPPQFLVDLGNEVCKSLGLPPQRFTNYIISLYEPGFHLEPHVDVDPEQALEYGFSFGEKVFGLIIEPDPTGHLYFVKYTGKDLPPLDLKPVANLNEQMGTTFVLQGPYRHKPYNHGVSKISKQRISVTFRTVNLPENIPQRS